MSNHLTEEQVLDLLLNEPRNAAVEAHLQSCEACRRELENFSFATQDLKELGSRWAEGETTEGFSIPMPQAGFRPSSMFRFAMPVAAAIGAVIFGVSIHRSGANHIGGSAARTPSAQVVADNLFLREMDDNLRYSPVLISVSTSELRERHTRQHFAERRREPK